MPDSTRPIGKSKPAPLSTARARQLAALIDAYWDDPALAERIVAWAFYAGDIAYIGRNGTLLMPVSPWGDVAVA